MNEESNVSTACNGSYLPKIFRDLVSELFDNEKTKNDPNFSCSDETSNENGIIESIGNSNIDEGFDYETLLSSDEECLDNGVEDLIYQENFLKTIKKLIVELMQAKNTFSREENMSLGEEVVQILRKKRTVASNDEILEELEKLVPCDVYEKTHDLLVEFLKDKIVNTNDKNLEGKEGLNLAKNLEGKEGLNLAKKLIFLDSLLVEASIRLSASSRTLNARIKLVDEHREHKVIERAASNIENYIDKIKGEPLLKEELERRIITYEAQLADKQAEWEGRDEVTATVKKKSLNGNSSTYAGNPRVKYKHVYMNSGDTRTPNMNNTSPNAIFQNSEHKEFPTHTEISFPISKSAPALPEEKQIKISDIPLCVRSAFKGYEVLNTVQSITFPTAFNTSENMLVCAPTGAGKTDVALLAILRVLMQNMCNGVITDTHNFKIIYITPMKALASEIVAKLSSRLGEPREKGGIGAIVLEHTGDTDFNRSEISAASVIVATPEKWDATTRSSLDESELLAKVCLLIIDEIHILNEERGGIIESLVARFQRYVNIKQKLIRIIGLSATLPNYIDVAKFLCVNPNISMFYFDSSYRPLPLRQIFIGIKGKRNDRNYTLMENQCLYEKTVIALGQDHQVMVFVHSRQETIKTAKILHELILQNSLYHLINPIERPGYKQAHNLNNKFKNSDIREMFQQGIGIHNAGLSRQERNLMESSFRSGLIRIICTTSTLAWGVNMPASCVIIKGTTIYSSEHNGFTDLPITDVLQIFGRAGRPQYEKIGTAHIITSHKKLNYYVSSVLNHVPIESHFEGSLVDNLNAEIALGTLETVSEAIQWLDFTFLSVRMYANPIFYGIKLTQKLDLVAAIDSRKREMIIQSAKMLSRLQMITFDEKHGIFASKELGRIASSSYISYPTVEVFNSMIRPNMTAVDVISTISLAKEFENLKTRSEELEELEQLHKNYAILESKGALEDFFFKASVLIQSHISRANINSSTLFSDSVYISKNAVRMLNAMFNIACYRNWGQTALIIHTMKKAVERCMWPLENPLRQFNILPEHILTKLENMKTFDTGEFREMSISDLGRLINNNKLAQVTHEYLWYLPDVIIDVNYFPITRAVLKVKVKITPNFKWNNNVHGISDHWWLWVEDFESFDILYHESFAIRQKNKNLPISFVFTIKLTETKGEFVSNCLAVKALSDTWMGCEAQINISLSDMILPEVSQEYFTDLLELRPLPISALKNVALEEIYKPKFKYFNPLQTQIFHTLYNGSDSVLLGAPTGSGKTIAAELAIWENFRRNEGSIAVYVAPLKALVTQRAKEWVTRFAGPLNLNVVKMSGEVTPDIPSLNKAHIIVTTPEKWDSVSRFWRRRDYVKKVTLLIIDEMHLLGGERGHVIEILVTRMKNMASEQKKKIRIVGLSTAFSDCLDVGEWMNATFESTYNFRNSVRPVPLEVHIDAFHGKHYCPRMDTMNKPIFNSILSKSPDKPVIIFVSSRRQTRLTATDIISFCSLNNTPKMFLHVDEQEIKLYSDNIRDDALRFSLQFGVGIHHAGLVEADRQVCEYLFTNSKIQVLVATSTLAWGVNFPAHMVIIKGTEFYDVSISGYKDYSITDVLQMMGRAGRPQFDNSGVAHIMVQDVKKDFYKKFLHEPFPLESNLKKFLPDHINAEIASGTIKTKQDMVEFLSRTFMFRRMHTNPYYYDLENKTVDGINSKLSEIVNEIVGILKNSNCVASVGLEGLVPTQYGRIGSFYYISHTSVKMALNELSSGEYVQDEGDIIESFLGIIRLISRFSEFSEIPVRHNEDKYNKDVQNLMEYRIHSNRKLLGRNCMLSDDGSLLGYDSPHVKTFLLIMAHICGLRDRIIGDYVTDTNTILGSCVRVIQSAVDISYELGRLSVCLGLMNVLRCIKQGILPNSIPLVQIPNITNDMATQICKRERWDAKHSMFKVINANIGNLRKILKETDLGLGCIDKVERFISELPWITLSYMVNCVEEEGTVNAAVKKKTVTNNESEWIVACSTVYQLNVQVIRNHTNNCPCTSTHQAPTSNFPISTRESWWCMLCDDASDSIIALSRISRFHRRDIKCFAKSSLLFKSPKTPRESHLFLRLISENYLGLDNKLIVKFVTVDNVDVHS